MVGGVVRDTTSSGLSTVMTEVTSPSIVLQDVTIAYQGHPAVHHVSGVFAPGSLTAMVGPNGAGKSTLLRAIAKQIKPSQGQVIYLEVPTHSHQPNHPHPMHHPHSPYPYSIAYLPQVAGLNPDFSLRVMDVVAMGLWGRLGALGRIDAQAMAQVQSALEQVNLAQFESRMVDELSVGQLQRVLFARLIVQDAPIILLDEPFNALDASTVRDLLQIVHQWHRQGRLLIAVLHDMQTVREHFEQTLLMARELIAWGPTQDVVTPSLMTQAEHASLAWHDAAPWCQQPQGSMSTPVKPFGQPTYHDH